MFDTPTACGYPGCDGYAEAVADGKADVTKCPVGGAKTAKMIAQVMGVDAEETIPMVATVMCRGDQEHCHTRFEYAGPKDCRHASLAALGDKACVYSCLGLGNCEKACPFGAITVNDQRLAVVDEQKCVGCGLCVSGCPRDVLKLLPATHPVHRICSAMEFGKLVRVSCTAGCVGCGKCERSCKFGALKMMKNLPEIDLDKCVGCMSCADNCPTGALKSNKSLRKRAVINVKNCVKCDACSQKCPFGAITRNEDGVYTVIAWNCTGCGVCLKTCKKDCIQLVPGIKYNR
jgi:electron transport complex protein RnfB